MEDRIETTQEQGQEEEIPRLRTPLRSYAYAALSIAGILAITAAMLYAWSQVL